MGKMVEIAKVDTGRRDSKGIEVLHPLTRHMDRSKTVVTSTTGMTIAKTQLLRLQQPSPNLMFSWKISKSW